MTSLRHCILDRLLYTNKTNAVWSKMVTEKEWTEFSSEEVLIRAEAYAGKRKCNCIGKV
ncbi:hypothetical protein D3C85_1169100 [compost metagenome]